MRGILITLSMRSLEWPNQIWQIDFFGVNIHPDFLASLDDKNLEDVYNISIDLKNINLKLR